MVFYDTTSSYFETDSDTEEELRQYGYSRDHRPDRKQILLGLAVDKDGLPLASDIFPGNTQDIDNRRTIIRRCPDLPGNRLFFFAQNSKVTFGSIEIRPLLD